MIRRSLLGGVIVLTLVVGMVAAKAPSPAAWGKGRLADTPIGRMVSGCVGRLLVLRSEMNVTDEQKAQIREILTARRSAIAETAKSVRDKRVVLRDAVLSGEADEAEIRAAADELGKAIGEAAVRGSRLRNEIAPVLTEEQQGLIASFLKENDEAVDKFLTEAAGQ